MFLTEQRARSTGRAIIYLDVVSALKGTKFDAVPVYSGRYGLGSKIRHPAQIVAVFNNAEKLDSQSVSKMTLQIFS